MTLAFKRITRRSAVRRQALWSLALTPRCSNYGLLAMSLYFLLFAPIAFLGVSFVPYGHVWGKLVVVEHEPAGDSDFEWNLSARAVFDD